MPLSEVINVARYEDPEWLEFHSALEKFSIDKHVFKHTEGEVYRKGWEWTHCIYGLSMLRAIKPSARALGVGAGREPVIFWLADQIREVVATDLYGNDTWSTNNGAEAPADIVEDAAKYCPRPFSKDRIRFENADGTNLPYEDGSFDLCWSLSSIEHFGGHEASRQAVREMARVTRKGGIVCIATEYLLLPELSHPEFFTKGEIEEYLIGATPDLELVDGMSWDLPPFDYLIDQICIGTESVHRRRRHVVLNDGSHQWTSFMLFFRKN
ncbi:class I SAM-dependent methyltransferase [Nitratireductor sp. GCM10026969]|uniref:class I SAM-dependent methyltransferase n=1 Tax=Nitratireductor sp. GCM10026969 TaxID=3252645 RepID=UPI00361AB884